MTTRDGGSRHEIGRALNSHADPKVERRHAERHAVSLKLSLTTDSPSNGGTLTAPASVRNMSRTGVLVSTRHKIAPGSNVTIVIPTDHCPDGMSLPSTFAGPVETVRVSQAERGKLDVALRFGGALTRSVEFGVFMDFTMVTADSHRPPARL